MKKIIAHTGLYLGVILSLSCVSTTPINPNTTVLGPDNVIRCDKHNIPLTTVNGYWTGEPVPMFTLSPEFIRYSGEYPNHMSIAEGLTQNSLKPERRRVRFCQACEEGLSKKLN